MYGTCAENNNGRRIERPLHISLLNSSQKASRYATRRQINSADDSIAACKLQKLRTENLSLKMKLRNIELTQQNYSKVAIESRELLLAINMEANVGYFPKQQTQCRAGWCT